VVYEYLEVIEILQPLDGLTAVDLIAQHLKLCEVIESLLLRKNDPPEARGWVLRKRGGRSLDKSASNVKFYDAAHESII